MKTTSQEIDDEFAAVMACWEILNDAILRVECAIPEHLSDAVRNLQKERRAMSSDMLEFHRRLGSIVARDDS